MKHLGIVPIILLLMVVGIGGLASAELTASQQVPSPVAVGDTVMVTVSLVYNGINSTEAVVTPNLPGGVVSDMPGSQSAQLYPGPSHLSATLSGLSRVGHIGSPLRLPTAMTEPGAACNWKLPSRLPAE